MRSAGFAVVGLVVGAGVAMLMSLPPSGMTRAVDTQGLHLLGVIFVALPVGAVAGKVAGLLLARATRR